MSEIILTPAAQSLVASDVRAFKTEGKRYATYITEMGVTTETVAEHVAVFRDAFKAANPKADGAQVKAYATKVRNGLNSNLKRMNAGVEVNPGKRAAKTEAERLADITAAVARAVKDGIVDDSILAAVREGLGQATLTAVA